MKYYYKRKNTEDILHVSGHQCSAVAIFAFLTGRSTHCAELAFAVTIAASVCCTAVTLYEIWKEAAQQKTCNISKLVRAAIFAALTVFTICF